MIAFGADVTLTDKAGATAERFAVKYGNDEARDVLKERARVLELVAWHKEAVREAAFWVQEAAAADAAVFSGVLCFTRRRRRVSRNTAQAQHAMEAEAERARVEAYRLEQKAKAEEREEKRKQKAAKERRRKQEAEERRRKLKALS